MTFRRLINSLGKDILEDIIDTVKEKYPKGKLVKCRILDYSRLDAVYICTVETSVLKEKFFTVEDLSLGQLVTAHITDIKDTGIVVKFGNLHGFIDNLHLSNAQYSENLKSKFRVNQKLKARVLCIFKNNSIRLTAKPAIVESDICLKSDDEAEIGKQFPGVVVKREKFGAVVTFYGHMKGFIHCTHLLPGETAEATELLYDGQIVNVIICGKNAKGLELSLFPIKEEEDSDSEDNELQFKKEEKRSDESQYEEESKVEQPKIRAGKEVSGIITSIQDNGLRINIIDKNIQAFIPLHHLSVNYDLNPLLLSTF